MPTFQITADKLVLIVTNDNGSKNTFLVESLPRQKASVVKQSESIDEKYEQDKERVNEALSKIQKLIDEADRLSKL